MALLHLLQESRRIDHEGEREQISERRVGTCRKVELSRFPSCDRFRDLSIFVGARSVKDGSAC